MRTVPGNDNVSKLVKTLYTARLLVPQTEALTFDLHLQLHSTDLVVGFASMISGFSESSVFVCVMYDYELGRWTWGEESCLLYTSPSPRDISLSRMPSSA